MFPYPRFHLRFSIAMFYVFVLGQGFYRASSLASAEGLSLLCDAGAGAAVLMWFVVDSMVRKTPVPFVSMSPLMRAWPIVVPAHYFRTRGRRGLRRFIGHAVVALLAWIVGGALALIVV